MNNRIYFLYRYEWLDGRYYIGKTYEGSKRFDNAAQYGSQYVGRFMNFPHDAKILKRSSNPFVIGFEEAKLIQEKWPDANMLNAKKETKETEIASVAKDYLKDYNGNIMEFTWDLQEAEEEYGNTIY